ncbi:tellurite resistance TerB family protein [Brenneria tiliae]|uniref:tellurite resistance TerB family protein n=1 Tax=Brenneria tiliae TaxID=2914984 RepID=UPI002014F74A|nr:TerB N-terminal domain-containing protein [Brenneria tiliae]MCL2896381.1 TerB N-terminal domain-containing protein [Brenneria tiliae]MCL2900851.1 TerB N-terminal domain-containing protein [Brenneria tiliae]
MGFWIFVIALAVIWFLFSKKKKSPPARINSKNISPINNTSRQKSLNKPTNSVASMHSQASDDDELATFTFVNGQTVEYSTSREQSRETAARRNITPARWVKPGESVTIQNVVINHGNFYFGGQLKTYSSGEYGYLYNDGSDASLVNDALPIEYISRHYQDGSLGYWPSFATLSPRCRGAYLDWLASDRSDASSPVGYVFIYFYGLERRILADGTQEAISDNEFKALFEEISRLRTVFQASGSFRHYATQLLEMMIILRPTLLSINSENEYFSSRSSLLFRLNLSTTVDKGQPVSADLALAWLHYFPDYTLRTPARRCHSEFSALFKQRYTQKYGDGIVVKANKTRLHLSYTPASGTLREIQVKKQMDLPDPSVLKAPIQKLIPIAESCINALDAYSRYLGKKDASGSDVAAIMLLPDEILTEDAEHMFAEFKHWADERIRENSGLATVAGFWARLDMPVPDKINKKEAELMQNFAKRAGYGIAPDMRYHLVRPEPEGNLVLFPEGHAEFYIPSAEFTSVSVALRLGAMIAQMDKRVDVAEQAALERTIDHNDTLSPTEKRSLHAYLTWRLNTPASQAGLKGKIEQLSNKEKSTIGNVIINVACADGKIDPAEIKQLEKIYASLGLDSSTVTSDIHRLSTAETTSTARLQTTSETSGTFSLDERTLARHESDTTDVRQLLSTIFAEDEPANEPPAEIPSHTGTGLDEAHHQLYLRLLEKERWARNEVAELCQSLNLMVSGAIEAINDWSYEQVDAPVLDDDGDIYVDLEIAQELKG